MCLRGGVAAPYKQTSRYLEQGAAGEVRTLLQQWFDIPGRAEFKVASHLLDRRGPPPQRHSCPSWDYFQNGEFPSSHHREEGGAERSRKYCAASAFCEDGVVFRSMDKEHHPAGVHKEASRHFLGDAATPPRGDARRGIRFFKMRPPITYRCLGRAGRASHRLLQP